jgi:hypothetical protein
VAKLGETRARNQTNVSGTNHGYVHKPCLPFQASHLRTCGTSRHSALNIPRIIAADGPE